MDPEHADAFYERLKAQLQDTSDWPADYLYKFIIPSDPEKSGEISRIFDNTGAVIRSKTSRKGTYTSISITVRLKDPDEVIAKYREVSRVEGVISL